jgi:hypothetical protein
VNIYLVINDYCVIPTVSQAPEEIRITIGVGHDFDDILDVTSGVISNEQIAHIHRLWSDDEFPRNFNRVGDELIISARA